MSELPLYRDGWIVYQQIDYSACDQETYQQDIVIHRTAGTAYNETANGLETWHLYVGSLCREDYGDIRFTNSTGAELAYYLWPDYNSSSARFCVRLEGADAAGSLFVWYGNAAATTTSDGDAVYLVFDHFEGATLDTTKWNVGGNVSVADGVCTVIGAGLNTAGIASKQVFGTGVIAEIRHQVPTGSTDQVALMTGFSPYLDYNSGVNIYYTGNACYVWASGGAGSFATGGTRNAYAISRIVRSPSFTNLYNTAGDLKSLGPQTGNYSFSFNSGWTSPNYIDWVLVRAYSATPPVATAFSEAVVAIPTIPISATKTYSGTIQRIAVPEGGSYVSVQTENRLYLQEITDAPAFGTTVDLGARTGTPYDLAITNNGANLIEGRGPLADIFRFDGAQVGTYTTGGLVRAVAVAQKNGLYAAAGSDDGKYYVFSKDASSSWYLLHASDSLSPVTALAMSWRGETLVVGRSDGHLVAFRPAVEEEEFPGTIRLLVYKDALPYTGARLVIEHGGTNQTWETATTIITDDYGVATAQVRWGEYIRVTVGENELQRVILPNPQQTEYVFRIKGPDPLRTGAQYSSAYDPDTQRIYLYYDDTREKTHLVRYEIIRSVDNTVVFQREYTTLPVNDYYQIPAGWTNSSYRIQLTASGSPSFTNTWSQWVGADGVASLPADLDTYARMGIAFFLILFVAGLFSYLTGPQGAVVVSLFAGALVLWGWLPLSPTIVALCIVWAFLGLLGRTSGE